MEKMLRWAASAVVIAIGIVFLMLTVWRAATFGAVSLDWETVQAFFWTAWPAFVGLMLCSVGHDFGKD